MEIKELLEKAEIKAFKIDPKDTIIVRYKEGNSFTEQECNEMSDLLKKAFPDNTCILLDSDSHFLIQSEDGTIKGV